MLEFALQLADCARDMVLRAAIPLSDTKPDRSFVTILLKNSAGK